MLTAREAELQKELSMVHDERLLAIGRQQGYSEGYTKGCEDLQKKVTEGIKKMHDEEMALTAKPEEKAKA